MLERVLGGVQAPGRPVAAMQNALAVVRGMSSAWGTATQAAAVPVAVGREVDGGDQAACDVAPRHRP